MIITDNSWDMAWQGNIVDPPQGIVADGHTMIVLAHAHYSVTGVLLDMQPAPVDDHGDEGEPRRVPPGKTWELWDEYVAAPNVEVLIGDTHMMNGATWLGMPRADGLTAWLRPPIIVMVRAAVMFTRITQAKQGRLMDGEERGPTLAPVVFWNDGAPVAVSMPMRPTAFGRVFNPAEGKVLRYDKLRPQARPKGTQP